MMSDQPLQPFSPPHALLSYFPNGFSGSTVLTFLLYVALFVWAIYTIVAIYHWLKYSHGSWVAIPAILVHLAISFVLIVYTISSHAFLVNPFLP